VTEVLSHLRQEKLFCKKSKCNFNQSLVRFFGHVIGAEGLSMQQDEVAAVMEWPTPRTKVELQSFLGLANYYRRFISNFSAVVAPLTDATKGEKKAFDWGGEQDRAFATIKSAFSTAPVLRLPVQNKAFTVTTDASDFGIGGVLEEEFDDGVHPIAYVSRKLNVPERNYPTHDRELLAIVHVVKELRCYLHGSAFVVRTGHHPLRYLLETKPNLSKRQVRWLDTLAEYDYKIEYIQGKWNIAADALSRRSDGQPITFYTGEDEAEDNEDNATQDPTVAILTSSPSFSNRLPLLSLPNSTSASSTRTVPQQEGNCEDPPRIASISASTLTAHKQVLSDLTKDYLADPTYQEEYRLPQQFVKKDGLFDKQGRLCVPDGSTRLVLMHDSHDAIVSGNLGVAKTLDRLSRNFTWPSMHAQVTAYVSTCDRCQRDKSSNQRPAGLLQPLEVHKDADRWRPTTLTLFWFSPTSMSVTMFLGPNRKGSSTS
jgi:RNase H-like domain found in reverse transcriptase/Integrase zinc binding domain